MGPDPAALVDNPFAALTAVVGPAILANACSVLALGTSNRLARVVDRTRVVLGEMVRIEPGTPQHQARARQREGLHVRAQMLLRSLRCFYAALGAFAAAAILLVIGTVLVSYGWRPGFTVVAAIALVAGGVGVVEVVSGCVGMVRETRLAVRYLEEEATVAPLNLPAPRP